MAEKDTKVGNWATAESVPRTQFFDQARGKVGGITPTNRNGQAFVEDGQLRPNTDAAKTEDSKPRRGSGNSRRTDRPSVRNEDVVRKSSTNPRRQRNEDPEKYNDDKQRWTRYNDSNRESKPAERAARNPTSDWRLASEGTPGRIRSKANTTVRYSLELYYAVACLIELISVVACQLKYPKLNLFIDKSCSNIVQGLQMT
ncbi:uncharacterized protein LOC122053706 isoform X2 [Zingiber officinale]|uniref:uncharacterized protein LOC122053706 isoform X2 n=1 Tax=Zingiber officinale TaxID=94328 RepID=UPI001C4C6F1B|nr:uncharacterized protein LOC122053706 isoform X2 [Zingiber officinale]